MSIAEHLLRALFLKVQSTKSRKLRWCWLAFIHTCLITWKTTKTH